ncbi:hypothetical protein PR048_026024 [Dryococelus australis]|uniref:Uncharacterized protein n=1 Tax=Dryococelus australis TaxID=614101 RepID=A0ABQ9GK65_9NEOP|nr:hypothetical protein PR048_026024 [Dryococelus australis]
MGHPGPLRRGNIPIMVAPALSHSIHTRGQNFTLIFDEGNIINTHVLPGIRTQNLPHHRSVAHQPTAPREVGFVDVQRRSQTDILITYHYAGAGDFKDEIPSEIRPAALSNGPSQKSSTSGNYLSSYPNVENSFRGLKILNALIAGGRSGVTARAVASPEGESGSIPCTAAPRLSHLGIVPDDTRHDGYTARFARRSNEALGVCATVARAAVAELLYCSPPPRRSGFNPDFCMWESRRMMSLVGGFSRRSPVSPALTFRCWSLVTSIILIGYQDLDKPEQYLPQVDNIIFSSHGNFIEIAQRNASYRSTERQGWRFTTIREGCLVMWTGFCSQRRHEFTGTFTEITTIRTATLVKSPSSQNQSYSKMFKATWLTASDRADLVT